MARKIIDIGVVGNDGTGDSIRDSFRKVNDNFRELYSSLGLGERLTFIGLDDTPPTYAGQNDPTTGLTPIITVNNTESGVIFKSLKAGSGVSIDYISNENEITINSEFSSISADPSPSLGGSLNAFYGGIKHPIGNLPDLRIQSETASAIVKLSADHGSSAADPDLIATNKGYVDGKVSLGGATTVDPATGVENSAFGRMGGPLILSRDPEPDDDEIYDGLVAATKRYVDNSSFGSQANLYVALSGADERVGVNKNIQGRALAYAYRTIEAALRRAEELVLEAKIEMGPYKKTLTYNRGEAACTLTSITTSPLSGTGFVGTVRMSVDTVNITSLGTNYFVGDILQLTGGIVPGDGAAATIEVLSTFTTPGAIATYRIVSTGVYSELPGSTSVGVTIATAGGPESIGAIGVGALFDVTYKVNSVAIVDGGGSASDPLYTDYSLVSVRLAGGGGTGAFGTAVVSGGQVSSITITDKGTGFTSLPTVSADLPRFSIFTNGLRTDFTGDVLTDTPVAFRGRDIREGLFLRGETSGALAQILSHSGELDSEGNELFDIDIKDGAFVIGEEISYGDVTKNIQITVKVESGTYEENYPLKLPQNVSIVGDEFRRVIVKPRPGTSSSPWAFNRFRRDLVMDGLTTATGNKFGYHYLQDSAQPVYPKISNPGAYTAAATLLQLNRDFLQTEIVAWIDDQITNNIPPFTSSFVYNETLFRRDIGLIVDSIVFDLKWGSYNRTVSSGLKYYQSDSGRIAITTQLSQTLAAIDYLNILAQSIIDNEEINNVSQFLYPQVIDKAFAAEVGSDSVIENLIITLKDVIDGSGSVNYPKENDQMDVFLANDAVRWQAISAIGHGGFMGVLDPEGQILSRSPYFQECASFSKSINAQTFAGGMFVDGFAGNLQFQITNVQSPTRIEVAGLDRFPQLPCSFIVQDIAYRVNYVRDYVYGIGDFTYNQEKCSRDVGLIVNAVLDDLIFDTNYKQLTAAFSYLRSYSSVVTNFQKSQTIAGLNYARDQILAITTDPAVEAAIVSSWLVITNIINAVSDAGAPALTFAEPTGTDVGIITGAQELIDNREFLQDELVAYIEDTLLPITGYDEATYRLDQGYIIDALTFDLFYGGNSATITAAGLYYNSLEAGQIASAISIFTRLQSVIDNVIQADTAGWTKSTSNTSTQVVSSGAGSSTAADTVVDLLQIVINVITSGEGAAPSVVDPTYSNGINYGYASERTAVLAELSAIQSSTITFLDNTYSAGSTATLVLDETTPWTAGVFTYDSDICSRDVGYIIDGLGYDIVFNTNYNSRKAGLTYREANAAEVIENQLNITTRSITYAHELANEILPGLTYEDQRAEVDLSETTINIIAERGTFYAPSLFINSPPGLATVLNDAKVLVLANIDYIKDEVTSWIDYQVANDLAPFTTSFEYNAVTYARDVGYIVEALAYDLAYGGNQMTRDVGLKYYDGVGDDIALQIPTGELSQTVAAIDYAKYLIKQVIVDADPAVAYSSTVRVDAATAGVSASDSGTQATVETLISDISDTLAGGVVAAPALTLASVDGYSYDATDKAARTLLLAAKTTIQAAVIDFVNENGNLYELLMPGNRSMLCNDFTQINDLGYGIFATNGGLVEAVSMFTYYCHISYYSLNGAQIRSVGGSSAHGNFALVAEGSDPLELPTPTELYAELAQGVSCYNPGGIYANSVGGLAIYVYNYTYDPLNNSELEIDHSGVIYRYPVTSVSVGEGLPPGIARLNLTSDDSGNFEGLFAIVPNDTLMTLRCNAQIILTGNLVDVAVRPSTGLIFAENPEVYRVLQFEEWSDSYQPWDVSISKGAPAQFSKLDGASVIPHKLTAGYPLSFVTSDTLPEPLTVGTTYYVSSDGLTSTTFRVALTETGDSIETTTTGVGTHSYNILGLTKTTLRENYNYVNLTVLSPGEFVTSGSTCTFSIDVDDSLIVSLATHGFSAGDVVKFTTSGTLPLGLSDLINYHVSATDLTLGTFKVSPAPGGDVATVTTTGLGGSTVGLVTGRAGDTEIAVVPASEIDSARLAGSKFNFKGLDYTVVQYENETATGGAFGRLTFTPALVNSMIAYESAYTINCGVAANTRASEGTLTIRISLTRVTSHDLLEIGTGSYADTNYPSEIYGPAVNPFEPAQEVVERDVGRCFYVITDQYGNFSVGPYFKVDQGTGTVTFSAAIALSNLDGIGFKRGVPVSEFSTDTSFEGNAVDTVPTENAVRSYIDRRLGVTHQGGSLDIDQIIPSGGAGGFMALSGQLPMKGDLNVGNFQINALADPTNPQDAVNLQSLTFDNFQDFTGTGVAAKDIVVFTGTDNQTVNAAVTGDLNVTLGTNTLNFQINSDTIINADVKSDAAIAQSKLAMTAASTRANATGIAQADLGLASFDSAQFTATNGWLTVKDNGLVITKIAQIATKTVLGNSTLGTSNVTAVTMANVVDLGLGVKKAQYSATGFLRRINGSSFSADGDYTIIEAAAGSSASLETGKLISRDSNGDFGGRIIDIQQVKVDTKVAIDTSATATGGYLRYYGYDSAGGILISSGSLAGDKATNYWNDAHYFKTQNGVSFAPIQASSIQVSAITTGGNTTSGTITGRWTLTGTSPSESRLQATYSADLAEYYEGDKDYEVGTVLVFGGDKEVTLTDKQGDPRVAGVVSNTAAFVMYDACPGLKNLVALQGRVPCKVVGKIKKGDMLVTSRISGVAVAAGDDVKVGTVVGKALETYDSDHIGTIEIAVGRT